MSKASDLFVFTPSMEEVIEAIDELLPDGSAKTLRRALAAHDATVRADHEKAVRERIARNIEKRLLPADATATARWVRGRAAGIAREGS